MLEKTDLDAMVKDVCDELGAGHLEGVYKQALLIALRFKNFKNKEKEPIKIFECDWERVLPVYYRDNFVGFGKADIVVRENGNTEFTVIEGKRRGANGDHRQQVLVYMRSLEKQQRELNREVRIQGYLVYFPSSDPESLEEEAPNESIKKNGSTAVNKKRKKSKDWEVVPVADKVGLAQRATEAKS